MNLYIYTGATDLTEAAVTAANNLTAVTEFPALVYGDTEPLAIRFTTDASGTQPSWANVAGHVVDVTVGELGSTGAERYAATSNFTYADNTYSGTIYLGTPGFATWVGSRRNGKGWLDMQIRHTDTDGETETLAVLTCPAWGSVPGVATPETTPVSYADYSDVLASQTAASGSATTAEAAAATAEAAAVAAASPNIRPKLVATNSAPMTCIGLTTTTAITARARHVITSDIYRIQFRYDSIQNGTADGEVGFLNQVELMAAIELPDGTICPLFFNGKRLALFQQGATLYTDFVDVELTDGDVIFSRTFVSRLASTSYATAKGEAGQLAADKTYLFYNYTARGDSALNNNGESVKYTAATGVDPFDTDATLTAGALPTTTGANYCFIPSAILGDTVATTAGALILGTSIEKGAGDQWIDAAGYGGWAARACNEVGIGVCNLAVGSSNYTDHWKDKSRTSAIRGTMAKHARMVIMGGPTNDIGTYYADVPAIKAAILAVANRFADQGLLVFCDTAQPHTTSTDSWTTLANQTTTGAAETARQAINAWLRTVPAPFTACLDTASVVEDAATGKWLAPVGGVLASGTCTSGTAVYRLVDSAASFPGNDYAGHTVRNTSVEDCAYVLFNGATTVDISGLAVGLSSGQTYEIYAGLTYDGLHCTGVAHKLKSDKAKEVLALYA